MFKKLLEYLFKDFYIFTAAYSNNVFPDPLSKEEEEKYVDLCLKGDKMARDILIEHNLRLVAHIVKKYDHKKEDADDLIVFHINMVLKLLHIVLDVLKTK